MAVVVENTWVSTSASYDIAGTVPLSSGATAGNLLVGATTLRSGTLTTSPDTFIKPNLWTERVNIVDTGASAFSVYTKIATGNANDDYDISWAGGDAFHSSIVIEVSGLDPTAPFEAISTSILDWDNSSASGTVTPVSPLGAAIAILGVRNNFDWADPYNDDTDITVDSGFVNIIKNTPPANGRPWTCAAIKLYSDGASQNVTWFLYSGGGGRCGSATLVFKEAAQTTIDIDKTSALHFLKHYAPVSLPFGLVTPEPTEPPVSLPYDLFSNWETGALQPHPEPIDGWGYQGLPVGHPERVNAQKVVSQGEAHPFGQDPAPAPKRGTKMMRLILKQEDWIGNTNSPRSQLVKATQYYPLRQQHEYWVGLSLYFTSDFVYQTANTNAGELFFQCHGTGGSTGTSPPFSFSWVEGQWLMVNRRGEIGNGFGAVRLWSGTKADIPLGQWNDFVFNFIPAADNNGKIRVWKNGVQIVSHLNTPTTYWQATGNNINDSWYHLLDIYIPKYLKASPPVTVTDRTAYFDMVTTYESAIGEDGYANVDPNRANTGYLR